METAFQEYMQRFEEDDFDGALVAELIEVFGPRRTHMKAMYERYKANGKFIPAMTKELPIQTAFDSRVAGDYISEAVDLKIGYFAGVPIAYSYDSEMPEAEAANDVLKRFNRLNRIQDLDSETAKWSAITGYGVRLLYIDEELRERVMNVPSYDCIFIGELTEPTAGLRMYQDGEDLKVDVYTAQRIVTFLETDGEYTPVEDELNVFQAVPLIGYPNNSELQGDCDKVLPIIDGIDEVLSNSLSEDTAQRLAYMAFEGGQISSEDLTEARANGAFMVPAGGKVYFITKDINDTARQNLLTHLVSDFYRFTKTPNLRDEAFTGNSSGVALKFQLFPFNAKVTTFQRKFESGTLQMFTALANVWGLRGNAFDPLNVYLEFTENFPLDLLNEAQVQQTLAGLVSEETRLGLFSAIDNPKEELEQMQQEQQDKAFMGSNEIDTNQDTTDDAVPDAPVDAASQFVTE
ncbi:phage portal protein [Exiguobacterium oxidotolerans]|uniref:phage portal protein n=1 Tax=Exiguobacterium oxidotolerans TaxID=223958 RepID=UPI0006901C9D|nr:phage portal protein [Exiguobacterium oxidotolerans]